MQAEKLFTDYVRCWPSAFRTYEDSFDSALVLTFVGETRVLGMNSEEELDEVDIPGFDSAAQVRNNLIVW